MSKGNFTILSVTLCVLGLCSLCQSSFVCKWKAGLVIRVYFAMFYKWMTNFHVL